MTASADSPNLQNNPSRIRFGRVAAAVVPIFLLIAGGAFYHTQSVQQASQQRTQQLVLHTYGLDEPIVKQRLSDRFQDADGDLLADAPKDESKWLAPNTLVFAYIASPDTDSEGKIWKTLLAEIAKATGKRVEYRSYAAGADQLAALSDGELHITALNTGSVPSAVNSHGFVPFCAPGRDDGSFGYKMEFIVAASSPIKTVDDLRQRSLVFTRRTSNSGFKAAVVMLKHDYGLLPERDYRFEFSLSHSESIRLVAAGQFDAAPVASDMLDRSIDRQEVKASQLRSIYQSERFPPAAIGYAWNLHPELAKKVRDAILSFDYTGTNLRSELGDSDYTQFVPISYKDDFAIIRRIDDVLGGMDENTGQP